jgi:hypothetical protein
METVAHISNWIVTIHKEIMNPAHWGALFATALGAFVGAYAAFKLEHNARVAEEQNRRATEGNLALLTFMQMYDALGLYRGSVIEALPQDELKPWLSMRITYSLAYQRLAFDAARLHFLFDCKNPNILPDVLIEGRRFDLTMEMIETHRRLMQNKVHPILSNAGIAHGSALDESDWEMLLGPALSTEVREVTAGILANVPSSMEGIKRTFALLREQLRLLLRDQKLIQAEFVESKSRTADPRGGPHFWRVEQRKPGDRPK